MKFPFYVLVVSKRAGRYNSDDDVCSVFQSFNDAVKAYVKVDTLEHNRELCEITANISSWHSTDVINHKTVREK